MKTVGYVLRMKGYDIHSIEPEASMYDAIEKMADKGVGALLVIDSGEFVGIITERDYARKVILRGRSSKETAVREIMTTNVLYVSPNYSIEECMELMTVKHIRHLPVMSSNKLVGVISQGDLVKAIISDQKSVIKRLENYILENAKLT